MLEHKADNDNEQQWYDNLQDNMLRAVELQDLLRDKTKQWGKFEVCRMAHSTGVHSLKYIYMTAEHVVEYTKLDDMIKHMELLLI